MGPPLCGVIITAPRAGAMLPPPLRFGRPIAGMRWTNALMSRFWTDAISLARCPWPNPDELSASASIRVRSASVRRRPSTPSTSSWKFVRQRFRSDREAVGFMQVSVSGRPYCGHRTLRPCTIGVPARMPGTRPALMISISVEKRPSEVRESPESRITPWRPRRTGSPNGPVEGATSRPARVARTARPEMTSGRAAASTAG